MPGLLEIGRQEQVGQALGLAQVVGEIGAESRRGRRETPRGSWLPSM